jgi:hypothetical protein
MTAVVIGTLAVTCFVLILIIRDERSKNIILAESLEESRSDHLLTKDVLRKIENKRQTALERFSDLADAIRGGDDECES